MNVTLKNIKYAAFMSEETNCFEATIYVDGKKAGHASNEGHGGPTSIHPSELETRLNAYGKTLPRVPFTMTEEQWAITEASGASIPDGTSFEQNGEYIIDKLIGDWLDAKTLKKQMSKKLLFTKLGANGIYETNTLTKAFIERTRKDRSLLSKIDYEKVLNFLPFEEALEIYKTAA